MDAAQARGERLIWSFWAAAALALVGGLLPLVFGGTSSRVSGVVMPYAVGAAALAACALLHRQSKTVVALVYFIAGLAIVYGILSMASVPIRLAALGSCPVAPDPCTTGLPRALSDGENNGLGSAVAFGLFAIFLGFFGLATLYRRMTAAHSAPPAGRIAPVAPIAPVATPPAVHEVEPVKTRLQEEPELPAPEELAELPAHESDTATT